jgi:hypothetical protein
MAADSSAVTPTPPVLTTDTAKSCGCSGKHTPEPVPAVTSANEVPDTSPEYARMKRMSANLLKHPLQLTPDAAARQRAAWAERFHQQSDPLIREEIITEMVQLDDAQTLDTMMGLFNGETHPGVRDQIILILGYMRATTADMPKVCRMLASAYDRDADPAERARMVDILSNVPAADAVAFMQTAFTSPRATADDRSAAAEGLFKLAPRIAVDADLLKLVTERLQHDAQSSPSVHERSLAAHALAAPGQDNKEFLRKVLESEQDPALRKFLKAAAEQFPTR